eukprot:scaffold157299_cov44-Cyclotella_meneghiniana.AAC.2
MGLVEDVVGGDEIVRKSQGEMIITDAESDLGEEKRVKEDEEEAQVDVGTTIAQTLFTLPRLIHRYLDVHSATYELVSLCRVIH